MQCLNIEEVKVTGLIETKRILKCIIPNRENHCSTFADCKTIVDESGTKVDHTESMVTAEAENSDKPETDSTYIRSDSSVWIHTIPDPPNVADTQQNDGSKTVRYHFGSNI